MAKSPLATSLVSIALAGIVSVTPLAAADDWSYPAKRTEKVFTFGQTRIVLVTDATLNQQHPDFILQVFKKGELQSQVHNVSFEQVFQSPDGKLFVGLSNRGIPGTAAVVFNDRGAISMLANHGMAQFDYCDQSVTLVRRWYDKDRPQVTFLAGSNTPGMAGITLRDCRGRTVDLGEVVLKAYGRSFTAMQQLKGDRSGK